jgi:5-methylcytosine-specific restriction endonuclease McrA
MKRPRRYTKEYLEPLVRDSKSIAQLLDKLGVQPTGGNYTNIKVKLRYFGIDTSHFTGQQWNKGLTKTEHPAVAECARKNSLTNEEIFCENSHVRGGGRVARRVRELNVLPYRCSVCDLTEWLEKPITLHLDHINGVNNDNRVENLRFLCPNCHQQTDTWGNKRRLTHGHQSN